MLVSLQEVNESQCIALWSYENMLSQQQYMCLENIMCSILLILLDSGVFISISECHIWSYIYMLNIKLESQYKLTCQKCDWHDLLSAVYFMLQRDTCNYTGWQLRVTIWDTSICVSRRTKIHHCHWNRMGGMGMQKQTVQNHLDLKANFTKKTNWRLNVN